MTEEKLTAGAFMKIVVLTVLGYIGFLGLSAFIFLLSLPLMNFELSLFLSVSISAIMIFALITILPIRRNRFVLSKRQTAGLYVAWVIVFVSSLPLIRIDPLLFLSCLPALTVPLIAVFHPKLWRRLRP